MVLFSLLPAGCRGPQPYNPAAAARAKLDFIRRHGSTLTPNQVGLLQRVPYRSSQQMNSEMERVLRLSESAKARREMLGGRRSILSGFPKEKEQDEEFPPKKETGEETPLDP